MVIPHLSLAVKNGSVAIVKLVLRYATLSNQALIDAFHMAAHNKTPDIANLLYQQIINDPHRLISEEERNQCQLLVALPADHTNPPRAPKLTPKAKKERAEAIWKELTALHPSLARDITEFKMDHSISRPLNIEESSRTSVETQAAPLSSRSH